MKLGKMENEDQTKMTRKKWDRFSIWSKTKSDVEELKRMERECTAKGKECELRWRGNNCSLWIKQEWSVPIK